VQQYATTAELSAHRRSAKHGRRAPSRSGRYGGVQARRVDNDKQRTLPLKKRQHVRAEQQADVCCSSVGDHACEQLGDTPLYEFKCKICAQTYTTHLALKEHYKTHTGQLK
jgi:hypothetical protein